MRSAEPDASYHDWDPVTDERPNDILPITTLGLNLQSSRDNDSVRLPPLQESPIQVQNNQALDSITATNSHEQAAATVPQYIATDVRSTPISRHLPESREAAHARFLHSSTAFFAKVLNVTNRNKNLTHPLPKQVETAQVRNSHTDN